MNSKTTTAAGTAGVLLALALTACSSFEIHGTVTSKQYLPGYTTYYTQAVYTQTCTTVEEEEEEPGPNGKGEEE